MRSTNSAVDIALTMLPWNGNGSSNRGAAVAAAPRAAATVAAHASSGGPAAAAIPSSPTATATGTSDAPAVACNLFRFAGARQTNYRYALGKEIGWCAGAPGGGGARYATAAGAVSTAVSGSGSGAGKFGLAAASAVVAAAAALPTATATATGPSATELAYRRHVQLACIDFLLAQFAGTPLADELAVAPAAILSSAMVITVAGLPAPIYAATTHDGVMFAHLAFGASPLALRNPDTFRSLIVAILELAEDTLACAQVVIRVDPKEAELALALRYVGFDVVSPAVMAHDPAQSVLLVYEV
ncbi:hypothetical protein H9P43_004360 [Blastocladiella emersonii ATCC 22665]|nr:hypothetical protein H9P43_004360 [Blastocladiella emersonii ATCC 22665]